MRGRKKKYERIKLHEKSLLILAFFVKLNLACSKRPVLFIEQGAPDRQTPRERVRCSVPMWLLCDDALVSCPQRDSIQTVSSSALLHSLCRSLSRILDKKRQDKNIISGQSRQSVRCSGLLTQVGSHQPASRTFCLAAPGGQLEKPQSRDQHRFNGTPLLYEC